MVLFFSDHVDEERPGSDLWECRHSIKPTCHYPFSLINPTLFWLRICCAYLYLDSPVPLWTLDAAQYLSSTQILGIYNIQSCCNRSTCPTTTENIVEIIVQLRKNTHRWRAP